MGHAGYARLHLQDGPDAITEPPPAPASVVVSTIVSAPSIGPEDFLPPEPVPRTTRARAKSVTGVPPSQWEVPPAGVKSPSSKSKSGKGAGDLGPIDGNDASTADKAAKAPAKGAKVGPASQGAVKVRVSSWIGRACFQGRPDCQMAPPSASGQSRGTEPPPPAGA